MYETVTELLTIIKKNKNKFKTLNLIFKGIHKNRKQIKRFFKKKFNKNKKYLLLNNIIIKDNIMHNGSKNQKKERK